MQFLGKPYDTLDEVIGIRENASSLKAFNVKYKEISLNNNEFDIGKITDTLKNEKIKLIHIQRSKGYSTRESLSIDKLEKTIQEIRKVDKDVIIFVDNCYCEFVERKTPLTVGADIIVRFAYKKSRRRSCTKSEHMLQERKSMWNLYQKGLQHRDLEKKLDQAWE